MADLAAADLVPEPLRGRIWRDTRRVRVGDVNPGGRVRLDALSTYVQDLAGDDTTAAGAGSRHAWVVRRAVHELHVAPRFGETLTLATWCSGLGRRWGERRVAMVGDRGARVESALLWVSLDPRSGRPVPVGDDLDPGYREAAGGREVSARLQHDVARPELDGRDGRGRAVVRRPWALRATDFDLWDHVNNAATWAMVEEHLAHRDHQARFRAEVEFRAPVEPGGAVEVVVETTSAAGAAGDEVLALWALLREAGSDPEAAPVLATTARVLPLDGGATAPRPGPR